MSIKALIKRLSAPSIEVFIERKAIDGLENIISDPDYGNLRLKSAEALGKLPCEKSAIVLGRFIDDDYVGKEASKSLAIISDSNPEFLIQAFNLQKVDVNLKLSEFILLPESPLQKSAALALAKLATQEATFSLVDALLKNSDPSIRNNLLLALTQVANKNPRFIINSLPKKESPIYELLINLISESKNDNKTQLLLSASTNAHDKQLQVLETTLIKLSDYKELEKAYIENVKSPIGQLAGNVLRKLGGENAIIVFLNDLSDVNRQNYAINSLVNLGSKCIPAIMQSIGYKNANKDLLYNILDKIGQGAAESILELILKQTDNECKTALTTLQDVFPEFAITGLRRIFDTSKSNQLDYEKGKIIIDFLNRLGWQPETNQEKAWLASAANDWVQFEDFGDDGIPALLAAQNAKSQSIRDSAKTVLSKMSGSIINVLAIQLQDKDNRLQAVKELEKFPNVKVLALMVEAVKTWSTKDFPVAFNFAVKMLRSGIGDPEIQKQSAELLAAKLLQEAMQYKVGPEDPGMFTYLFKKKILDDLDILRENLQRAVDDRSIKVYDKVRKFLSLSISKSFDQYTRR